MACESINTTGFSAIVCMRGKRQSRRRCSEPGCTARATKLCDFPLTTLPGGKTCDRDLCDEHAVKQADVLAASREVEVQLAAGAAPTKVRIPGEIGETVDFCPRHDALLRAPQQKKLDFGGGTS